MDPNFPPEYCLLQKNSSSTADPEEVWGLPIISRFTRSSSWGPSTEAISDTIEKLMRICDSSAIAVTRKTTCL